MELLTVNHTHIDRAWEDGAHVLAQACEVSGGEITGDQLKMILARGERVLLALQDEDKVVGWGVVRVDQLPNLRVLMITDLVAPGAQFERFFGAVKELARSWGCSRVRCAAGPAQARLYRIKCGFKPVYEILEVKS